MNAIFALGDHFFVAEQSFQAPEDVVQRQRIVLHETLNRGLSDPRAFSQLGHGDVFLPATRRFRATMMWGAAYRLWRAYPRLVIRRPIP